jgi:hypothetical protein
MTETSLAMSSSGRVAEASLAMPFRGHAGFASVPIFLAGTAVCNDRSMGQIRAAT